MKKGSLLISVTAKTSSDPFSCSRKRSGKKGSLLISLPVKISSDPFYSLIVLLAATLAVFASPARTLAAIAGLSRDPPETQPAAAPATQSASATTTPTGPSSSDSLLPWLKGLSQGYREAQARRQPILVRAGAKWCGWCAKLDKEIAAPRVQEVLANWTLVYFDVDERSSDLRGLNVAGVPALRILTSTGRLIGSHDGYLPADDLLAFLSKYRQQAAVAPPAELFREGTPTADAVAMLVAEFSSREPAIREAAIRRLLPHAEASVGPVAEAFAKGDLAARLAALELLQAWKAPLGGMDPWEPESMSEAGLAQLLAWAKDYQAGATETSPELTAEGLAEARRMIGRLLEMKSETDAEVLIEQLARYREALLPETYEQLKQAATDEQHERLTMLRYRLVAADEMVLRWPGGLARLASSDPEVRFQAADELAGQASAKDRRLLLELFSDPEPLVRESSLRAMQKVGGSESRDALIKLLDDPDANVRAVVLKQLADSPPPGITESIAAYIAKEANEDLLVHGIRVLRQVRDQAAVKPLLELLSNESWRVRAESAEAIGELLHTGVSWSAEAQAGCRAGLLKLLDDADGFVVSRALTGLQGSDVNEELDLDRVSAVIDRHPELNAEVMQLLTVGAWGIEELGMSVADLPEWVSSGQNRAKLLKAVDVTRKLCRNHNSQVRAWAITGLSRTLKENAAEELIAALADPSTDVRKAAANSLLGVLHGRRQYYLRMEELPTFTKLWLDQAANWFMTTIHRPLPPPPAESDWLVDLRAGKDRPAWLDRTIEPLTAMLQAESDEECVRAALPLFALGRDDQAAPALLAAVTAERHLIKIGAYALPWLPWDKRIDLCNRLVAIHTDQFQLMAISIGMGQLRDLRAAPALWDLLACADAGSPLMGQVQHDLTTLYCGEGFYIPGQGSTFGGRVAARHARAYARFGTESQQVVALSLLAQVAPDDARRIARRVVDRTAASAQLREDALIVVAASSTPARMTKFAIARLQDERPELRRLMLRYLTGDVPLSYGWVFLRQRSVPLFVGGSAVSDSASSDSSKILKVKPPEGLKREDLEPLSRDADAATRAYGSYLLVLLDDAEALKELLAYWRQSARHDGKWTRLVYRAISYRDDDSLTPVLKEIYQDIKGDPAGAPDFYWTIRAMTGDEVKALRKQMRTELGATVLGLGGSND